jgi:hypothetical protein
MDRASDILGIISARKAAGEPFATDRQATKGNQKNEKQPHAK